MAAVEQEQDETVRRNSKWNPFGKKVTNATKPSWQEEVAQYVKAFLAQAAPTYSSGISSPSNGVNAFLAQQTGTPVRRGPVTCYNCNKLGHIAMFCQAECVECGDTHAGAHCQVHQDRMERRQQQQQARSRKEQPESMLMEMMAVEKHTITPPVHPKPKMARPVPLVEVACTPEKVFPGLSHHLPDKTPVTYAQAAAAAPLDPASTILKPVLHGKRNLSLQVSRGKYKKPCDLEPTPTRVPSPVVLTHKDRAVAPSPDSVRVLLSQEETPLPENEMPKDSPVITPVVQSISPASELTPPPAHMLPELDELTPPPRNLSQEESPKRNMDDIIDDITKDFEFNPAPNPDVTEGQSIPLDSPDVERYIDLFKPSAHDKVTVETVPETPVHRQPGSNYSPLLQENPVPTSYANRDANNMQVPMEVDDELPE
ncbi:hypothetical protein DSO57_1012843 [Entomophthora muscae]|uniref:Uncharacterized protein n=1 Tax=Entomophthora muscae TaxID=34485 RepID=A0ACC2S866_9FUNG|nr:hypothetical protein DSO57_1012843 [Entomophthora muscae]